MLICKCNKSFLVILLSVWALTACKQVSTQTLPLTTSAEAIQFSQTATTSTLSMNQLILSTLAQITPLQTRTATITSPNDSNPLSELDPEQSTKRAVVLISKFYTLIAKDEFIKAYELYDYRPYSNDFTAFIKANLFPSIDNIDILDIKACCSDTPSKVGEIAQNFEVSLSVSTKGNKTFNITKFITLLFFDNRWQIAQIQDTPQNFPPTQLPLTVSVLTATPFRSSNQKEVVLTEKEKNILLGVAFISKFYTLVEIGELENAYGLFSPTSPSQIPLENFIAINLSDPVEKVDITNIEVCCEQSLPNESQMQKFHVSLQITKLNQIDFDYPIDSPSDKFEVFITLTHFNNQWQIYQKATSPQ
jgi:hypothetical protein